MMCRPKTPGPSSTTPPLAPEWNATRARKRPGDVIPLRRRRHRLADATRKSPSQRSSLPTNPNLTGSKRAEGLTRMILEEQNPHRRAAIADKPRKEHGPRRRGRRRLQPHTNRSSRTSPPANPRPRHNPRPIYTSARRFPGRPPSPTPDWPPERKRAGEIAAGRRIRAGIALSPLLSTVARGKEDLRVEGGSTRF